MLMYPVPKNQRKANESVQFWFFSICNKNNFQRKRHGSLEFLTFFHTGKHPGIADIAVLVLVGDGVQAHLHCEAHLGPDPGRKRRQHRDGGAGEEMLGIGRVCHEPHKVANGQNSALFQGLFGLQGPLVEGHEG